MNTARLRGPSTRQLNHLKLQLSTISSPLCFIKACLNNIDLLAEVLNGGVQVPELLRKAQKLCVLERAVGTLIIMCLLNARI
jgi:hypothetical protein